MNIREWRKVNTAVYQNLHQRINPGQPLPVAQRVWLLEEAGQMVGYTAVSAIPGLNDIYELTGGILPAKRRQGLGSCLLQHVLHEAPGLNIRQLSHCVTDLASPAAHFLRTRRMAAAPFSPAPLRLCFPAQLSN